MTTSAAKKDAELERFLAFQERCPECPNSKPSQPAPPGPDIVFEECDLGIEITEYSLGQSKDGSRPRQLETVHQRIAHAAQAEYELSIKRRLQVSVLWTIFNECPAKREEKSIAQAIARLVTAKTSTRQETCSAACPQFNSSLLQKYGVEVSVYPIDAQGPSCWSSVACFCFPQEAPRIQAALDEKESKIPEYRQSCRNLWLLIVADGTFLSSQFHQDQTIRNTTFCSSFDRVFLLHEPRNAIHEFKVEHRPLQAP
jgi:hypothetical protein